MKFVAALDIKNMHEKIKQVHTHVSLNCLQAKYGKYVCDLMSTRLNVAVNTGQVPYDLSVSFKNFVLHSATWSDIYQA